MNWRESKGVNTPLPTDTQAPQSSHSPLPKWQGMTSPNANAEARKHWKDIHFVLNKTQQERDEALAHAQRLADALKAALQCQIDGLDENTVDTIESALAQWEKDKQ